MSGAGGGLWLPLQNVGGFNALPPPATSSAAPSLPGLSGPLSPTAQRRAAAAPKSNYVKLPDKPTIQYELLPQVTTKVQYEILPPTAQQMKIVYDQTMPQSAASSGPPPRLPDQDVGGMSPPRQGSSFSLGAGVPPPKPMRSMSMTAFGGGGAGPNGVNLPPPPMMMQQQQQQQQSPAPEEKKKSKQCQRCDVNKAAQKVTITSIALKLCATCTDVVQADPIEAVAAVEKATGVKLEIKKQEPAITYCERCKKRAAHGRFQFDGKPTLCCQPCFTEHPDFQQMTKYGVACVWHKDFDEARSAFLELIKMTPNHAPTLYNLACVESLAGNQDEGFAVLQRALENGYNNWRQITSDEDISLVRSHAEFAPLIAKWQEHEKLNRGPGAGQRIMSAASSAKTALVKAKDSVKDGVSDAMRKAKEAKEARAAAQQAAAAAQQAARDARAASLSESSSEIDNLSNSGGDIGEAPPINNFSNVIFNQPGPPSIGNYQSVSQVHNNFSGQFNPPVSNFGAPMSNFGTPQNNNWNNNNNNGMFNNGMGGNGNGNGSGGGFNPANAMSMRNNSTGHGGMPSGLLMSSGPLPSRPGGGGPTGGPPLLSPRSSQRQPMIRSMSGDALDQAGMMQKGVSSPSLAPRPVVANRPLIAPASNGPQFSIFPVMSGPNSSPQFGGGGMNGGGIANSGGMAPYNGGGGGGGGGAAVDPNKKQIPSQSEYVNQSYWHGDYNRTVAESHLAPMHTGAFVLRPSSQFGCLSLSHRKADGSIGHALVHMHSGQTERIGWSIEDEADDYPTLHLLLMSLDKLKYP